MRSGQPFFIARVYSARLLKVFFEEVQIKFGIQDELSEQGIDRGLGFGDRGRSHDDLSLADRALIGKAGFAFSDVSR